MIRLVMKPYTMKWPLKSGFTASVMFKTLGNLTYQNFFQPWYTMSTCITQSIISRKANVMITVIQFNKTFGFNKNAGPLPWAVGPIINKSIPAIYHSSFILSSLHVLNASLNQTYRHFFTFQHNINRITISLTLTQSSFVKGTCDLLRFFWC